MPTPSNSHKRKGDSVFQQRENHVVVVNGNKEDPTARMDALHSELSTLRTQLSSAEDPILDSLKSVYAEQNDPIESLKTESVKIQAALAEKIALATEAKERESSDLAELIQEVRHFEQIRDSLLHAVEEMDRYQVELQEQIKAHQREAEQEIEIINSVDEERKREVPRLKTQFSLYASTTNIKWDFLYDNILSGSVVRYAPSQYLAPISCLLLCN